MLGGLLLLAVGLCRNAGDFLAYWPTQGFAIALIVRSAGIYSLLFGAAGVAIGGLLHGLIGFARRRHADVFAVVLGLMVAFTSLAYLTAWWQIEVLAGLPMEDPDRLRGALLHGCIALAAGAVTTGMAAWSARLASHRPLPARRLAAGSVALGCSLVLIGDAALAASGSEADSPTSGIGRAARVVVVGLDGMTLRVLSPLLRAGELPTIRRFVERGAWGTFLTYGTASSPRVWTSMATGKRVRDHGIDDFVKAAGDDYRAAPMRSDDRKVRAVWNILSDFGRRVALVDWLITFPPEPVDGYVVSRLKLKAENRTFPRELDAELVSLWPERPRDEWQELLWNIDRVFATTEHLIAKEPLDFVAVFDATIDQVEHRHWKEHDPDSFDIELWDIDPNRARQNSHRISDTYRYLDRKLGELMEQLPEDTLVIVVSDHGQLPAARPRVRLRLDRILEALGYARLAEEPDKDRLIYRESRAYTLVETPWTPVLRVNLNLKRREEHGFVRRRDAVAVADQLVAALQAIRFTDGGALFARVTRTRHPARDRGAGADIEVALSRQARDLTSARRLLEIGEDRRPLGDFQAVDRSISGDHDHQGVILAHGPGIEPGPIGQRAVPTALHDILWHLTDKVDAVDRVLPVLRRLGLIERASTLDLTPTVLYALGLPVARDMAGRPLREIFSDPPTIEWIESYETLEDRRRTEIEAPSDEELLEHLRSLGYVY